MIQNSCVDSNEKKTSAKQNVMICGRLEPPQGIWHVRKGEGGGEGEEHMLKSLDSSTVVTIQSI